MIDPQSFNYKPLYDAEGNLKAIETYSASGKKVALISFTHLNAYEIHQDIIIYQEDEKSIKEVKSLVFNKHDGKISDVKTKGLT